MKVSDLPEEERDKLDQEFDELYGYYRGQKKNEARGRAEGLHRFGLCAKCTKVWYARSEYGIRWAVCMNDQPVRLDSRKPIVECTRFNEHTVQPDLWEMKAMAHIITLDEKKAGF